MCPVRFRLKFGTGLNAEKPWMIFHLHDLNKGMLGVDTRNNHPLFLKLLPIVVIKFVSVPMSFLHLFRLKCRRRKGIRLDPASVSTEAHYRFFGIESPFLLLQIDNRMRRLPIELSAVCSFKSENFAGKINHGYLHAQANSEIRDFVFARIAGRGDFPICSAVSKSARNQNSIDAGKDFLP